MQIKNTERHMVAHAILRKAIVDLESGKKEVDQIADDITRAANWLYDCDEEEVEGR